MTSDEKFGLAVRAYEAGRYDEARRFAEEIVKEEPSNCRALNMLGMSLHDLGMSEQGAALIVKAIEIDSRYRAGYNNLAAMLKEAKQFERALAVVDKGIGNIPGASELHLLRAAILVDMDRNEEALSDLNISLSLDPASPEALTAMGDALTNLGRYAEAKPFHLRAIQMAPSHAPAWLGIAKTLGLMRHFAEALAACDRAHALDPSSAKAYLARGHLMEQLSRHEEAIAAYRAALEREPDFAEAWVGLGITLPRFGKNEEASSALERALAIKPDLKFVRGEALNAKMKLCAWESFERRCGEIVERVERGEPVIEPFAFLALPALAEQQLECARTRVAFMTRAVDAGVLKPHSTHPRIRIAYLSEDFRDHAVAQVFAGVLEHHDKNRFEIIAVSTGPDDGSVLRARIECSVDHFIDTHARSDADIVEWMRRAEIDVAVDLVGFTRGERANVFASRVAPIQVNYLGYAGTIGADFMDYILVDEMVVPPEHREYYVEKAAYLPDTFFPADDKRSCPEDLPSRRQAGLPEQGFVFCCFNASYKILPGDFNIWMRLLACVPESVLWLSDAAPEAKKNLRREAEARGVSGDRILFAPRLDRVENHLARFALADLFLDTEIYNAHATASDALWAGVPVLARKGATFAGRVAASLVKAAGLAEMAVSNNAEYEALALKLATDAGMLSALREKLARNQQTQPFFDTARYTRHLEAAYETMVRRYKRGEKPESFKVEPIG